MVTLSCKYLPKFLNKFKRDQEDHQGLDKDDSWQKPEVKISWHRPFTMTTHCFSQSILCLCQRWPFWIYSKTMWGWISMIFHIHYSRIKTSRSYSTGITVPEYPTLERGIQKKMLNEGGMVAALVGAFGASGALAYFLYHPRQVYHPWFFSGWSFWGLRSTGLFLVSSTPGKASQVLQWLEHLGLRSSGL